jgi:glutamate mutase epsilon subunit
MSTPTWGIYIPGYSYPSVAQRKKFDRMYPGAAAAHKSMLQEREKERQMQRRIELEEERKRVAACDHYFVPTNVDNNHVCRHCRHWVKTLADYQIKEKA